jgi:hypothetical protein
MSADLTRCRAKNASGTACRNRRLRGSLFCRVHQARPDQPPRYIDRCSMLLVQKSDTVAPYCPYLHGGESCRLWHESGRDREVFDTEKPHACDAFLSGRLLLLHHRQLAKARLTPEARGIITGHQIKYDFGPGYDWERAVVEVQAITDEDYFYIQIGEHWNHSLASPLARWLCRFDEISEFETSNQPERGRLATVADEWIEFAPFSVAADRPSQSEFQNFQSLVERWRRGR